MGSCSSYLRIKCTINSKNLRRVCLSFSKFSHIWSLYNDFLSLKINSLVCKELKIKQYGPSEPLIVSLNIIYERYRNYNFSYSHVII